MAHMLAHLATIVGKILPQYRRRLLTHALCDVLQMVLQMRQALLYIVAVTRLQMSHHHLPIDIRHFFSIWPVIIETVDIAHRQKEIFVHPALAAHLLHAFFTKSQRNAETRQHQYQVVILGYHIGHLHPACKKHLFHAAKIRKKNIPPIKNIHTHAYFIFFVYLCTSKEHKNTTS